MTASLYVLRHAKAEVQALSGGDHERDLRRRGRRAAKDVGRFLASLGETPERILCSSAVRARATAELARESGAFAAEVELFPKIYGAGPAALLTLLAEHGRGERVLLVGHEPALSQLIGALVGAEPEFPPAALARIDLLCERWSELAPETGRLVWLVTPELVVARRPRTRA